MCKAGLGLDPLSKIFFFFFFFFNYKLLNANVCIDHTLFMRSILVCCEISFFFFDTPAFLFVLGFFPFRKLANVYSCDDDVG